MTRVWRSLLFVFGLSLFGEAQAVLSYYWTGGGYGHQWNVAAACGSRTYCSAYGTYGSCSTYSDCRSATYTITATARCTTAPNTYPVDSNGVYEITDCQASCPAGQQILPSGFCGVPPCPSGVSGSYSFTGASLPASGCLSGCQYTTGGVSVGIRVDGVMKWVAGATSNGASCSGGDTMSASLPVTPTPDNCVVDSQGRTVCPGATSDCVNVDGHEVCGPDGIDGKNCQMVNGKVVCANATLDDAPVNCIISADGKMRCVGDTTAVETGVTSVVDPVTGNTTKTSVTTSGIAGSGTKTTITIYDSGGNVISSSTTLTGGFDPGSSGTGGTGGAPDGSIEGTGKGEGEGEGEEESVAAVFAGPSEGEPREGLSWGRTGEEVKAELSARWDAAPVVAAVNGFSNVSLSGSGGTCPNFCLPLFGETVCTEVHCDLWAAAAPVLGVVLLAVGVFLAIRIVLSA